MSANSSLACDVKARQERLASLYERSLATAQAQFDPVRHLIAQPAAKRPEKRTYRQATSLPLAHALLAAGDPEAVREAEAIVAAVLESQEIAPLRPHRGNWLWLADDPEVGDLNAVQFVLRGLLPLLVDHGDRLPADLLERCRESMQQVLILEGLQPPAGLSTPAGVRKIYNL